MSCCKEESNCCEESEVCCKSAAAISVNALENGPILLTVNGKNAVALCRCGNTANAPYCDGAHKEAGFEAEAKQVEIGG